MVAVVVDARSLRVALTFVHTLHYITELRRRYRRSLHDKRRASDARASDTRASTRLKLGERGAARLGGLPRRREWRGDLD